jgi:hypothetical protein
MTSANLRRSLMSIGTAVLCAAQAPAQPGEILCQPVECGTFRPLDEAHKGRLQDPFFRLVLDPRPDARRLADIEALIQGANGKRRFFVVHEEIQDPDRRGHRRAVVDFIGENAGFNLGANIMLSFAFAPDHVPEVPDLEVLAWDNVNGVYNYYKLDDERPTPGGAGMPDKVWKLAATSRNADQLRPQDRIGTCLACHMTGVPVMKELHFPWNNWHSSQSRIGYLVPSTPANRWPVTDDAHFKDLALAEPLEGAITNSIQAFNNRRFEQLVGKDAQGNLAVADAKRVLRPLFETTEINFASAQQRSNLHPLAPTPQTGPSQTIEIPSSFFLAADILASVGIDEVDFQSVARVEAAAYKGLIESSGVELEGATGPARGDTHFAWFTPEQGFVASHWIDTLVQNKLLSPAFVAAAAAADLENPIFSQQRASLLRFIPEAFTATPDEPHPDALTREVVTRLEAAQPQPGSVEAEFLATLQAPDPVAVVRSRVTAYRNRIEQRLAEDADPAIRDAELKRLFDLLIERRKTLVNLPEFRNLKESKALLPLPPQN